MEKRFLLLQISNICISLFSIYYSPKYMYNVILEDVPRKALKSTVFTLLFGFLFNQFIILRSNNKDITIKSLCIKCFHFILGIILFYIIIILFGAPFFELIRETFLLSCILAIIVFLPIIFQLNRNLIETIRFIAELKFYNGMENSLLFPSIGTIAGAYLGALPIPLDWDRPWQKWPLTCVYGAIGGHIIGSICTILYILCIGFSFQKEKL